jgi:hypothetical protein
MCARSHGMGFRERRAAPGYDHLAERRFAFIPVWGFRVFLAYCMRLVQCKTCGIVVEEVPWVSGKHQRFFEKILLSRSVISVTSSSLK